MPPDALAFRTLFNSYASALAGDVSRFANGHAPLLLPPPNPSIVSTLFSHVESLFSSESTLLELTSPCVIIGDIHGQILDLFRIINRFGFPGNSTYLFLGDLVDRGEFSVECLVCVFLMKALWPAHVWVIRGNHEFSFLCSHGGFMTNIISFFGCDTLYTEALRVFAQIPLAARIDKQILCVHGGIGPAITDVSVIAKITRPVEAFGDPVVDSLVWSDPNETVDGFRESPTRGVGYLFGEAPLLEFLRRSTLSLLVRAHECVPAGASSMFGDHLMTVFSASNYCGLIGNHAAVLIVSGPNRHRLQSFPPLPWLLRASARFSLDGPVSTRLAPGAIRKSGSALATPKKSNEDTPIRTPGRLMKSVATKSDSLLIGFVRA
jgi:protein phosphatase